MPEEVVYYVTSTGIWQFLFWFFCRRSECPIHFLMSCCLCSQDICHSRVFSIFLLSYLQCISADFIGTNILYFLFYNAGTLIMKKKPKWFPLSTRMIERLTSKISKGGKLSIYIFRLTPFTRGYTSVITGLLQIKPKIFLPIALISAITWATVYVVIGHLLGPSWHLFTRNIDSLKYILLGILVVVLCVFLLVYLNRGKENHKQNAV